MSKVGENTFMVTIDEGATRSLHEVTVTPQDISRYAPGVTAGRVVRASFLFLLERESKESILPRFGLGTIEQYFPDYPTALRQYL